MAFNLPSFYLSSYHLVLVAGTARKSAASRDHKVTPTWLKEPFKGTPRNWKILEMSQAVQKSSHIKLFMNLKPFPPECSGIDRILIMILKTLRTEFKDRFPLGHHPKSQN